MFLERKRVGRLSKILKERMEREEACFAIPLHPELFLTYHLFFEIRREGRMPRFCKGLVRRTPYRLSS